MWTLTSRVQHSRAGLRIASDLTDAEWAALEPMTPQVRRMGGTGPDHLGWC
jgi:putative transposase